MNKNLFNKLIHPSTLKHNYKNIIECSKYSILNCPYNEYELSLTTILKNISKNNINKSNYNNKQYLIQLNNQVTNNAMDLILLQDLYYICKQIENNKINKLILLGDSKCKSFSVGANLKEIYYYKDSYEGKFMNLYTYYFYYVFKTFKQINSLSIWNGYTIGGGVGLSIFSNYRIATESTVFCMPEGLFGFYTNCMYNYFISKFDFSLAEALYFNFIGRKLSSWEVYNKGLANYFILNKYIISDSHDINFHKSSLINFLKHHDIVEDKILLEKYLDYLMQLSLEEIGYSLNENRKLILTERKFNSEINKYEYKLNKTENEIKMFCNEYFVSNCDIDSFDSIYEYITNDKRLKEVDVIKEPNKYYFINYLRNCMLKKSKYSLKINYEITKMAYNNITYEDAFNKDLKALDLVVNKKEFYEGIRAYFIDKDKKPKWNDCSISNVNLL